MLPLLGPVLALLLVPTLVLAGPGHRHSATDDRQSHGDKHGHGADPHGVSARYGGEIFEAKGHHFEVLLEEKALRVIPRDDHPHKATSVRGKVLVQREGKKPITLALSPSEHGPTLPSHFVASGDASVLRQVGTKALVVLQGLPDTGKRGLSFWLHSLADLETQSHGSEDHDRHPEHSAEDGHDHHGHSQHSH